MDVLTLDMLNLWTEWIAPILLLVVGLGLVVFVHELGHFLIAKRVGIKVERFALGFGPRLFGFKRGETDYCVNLVPLGGYVKMSGQEDFAALKDTDEPDPRSYEGKSISQRMMVISAGVVMNVIFAAVLFVVVGLIGKDFPAPVIGGVRPNYPAAMVELRWQDAEAASQPEDAPSARPDFGPGLRPGDEVLELDGKPVSRFQDLQMTSVLADLDETFPIVVRRRDDAGRAWIGRGTLWVKKGPGDEMPVFGIVPAAETVFDEPEGLITASPFAKGDRLLAIDGRPIRHAWEIDALQETLDGRPVVVTVERVSEARERRRVDIQVQPALKMKEDVVWLADGRRGRIVDVLVKDKNPLFRVVLEDGSEKEFEKARLAGGRVVDILDLLGMVPRLQVQAVIEGSRAAEAGILPGDIVVGYGDHAAPTLREFLEINEKAAERGTTIVLLRQGKRRTLRVVPKRRDDGAQVGILQGADLMHAVVAGVREGSPAAKAGISPGDAIEKINGRAVRTWIDVFTALKELSGPEVTVSYKRGVLDGRAVVGKPDESGFDPADYAFNVFPVEVFKPLMVTIHRTNPIGAVAWGAGETWDFIVRTYATLRALIVGNVSTETLSGPVGIGKLGLKVGRDRPLVDFVYFMAFISATIAVINFLPIPVVDGGHAVLLLIEKIRGKPLPTRVANAIQFVGLAAILLAFVLLTWQDIARIIRGLW